MLARAGIEGATFLVACTGLDEVNIVACAIANKIGKSRDDLPRVAGRFSRRVARQRPRTDSASTASLWPEAQLAADIEQVVTAPGAIDAEVFAGGWYGCWNTGSRPVRPDRLRRSASCICPAGR